MNPLIQQFMALREALQGRMGPVQAPRAPELHGWDLSAPQGAVGPSPQAPAAGGDWKAGLSPAERWLIQKESSFRPTAKNPKSTAFGLGQLLIANRRKYLGGDYATTDPYKQLDAFRRYTKDRYGTAEKAQQFHQQRGWY